MRSLRLAACSAGAALLCCAVPSTVFALDSGSHSAVSAPCSASIEAAAHAVVGGQAGFGSQTGFRAQDVVIDPVLRRIWVRVADCSDSRRPLTLVPIAAPLANAANYTGGATISAQTPAARPVIRRGDAVDVIVQSATMHMALHGKANGEAAANGEVDVLLDSDVKNEEAPRHIRGIAIAEHRVEVHL